jgi:hypothetical protein
MKMPWGKGRRHIEDEPKTITGMKKFRGINEMNHLSFPLRSAADDFFAGQTRIGWMSFRALVCYVNESFCTRGVERFLNVMLK